MKALVLALLCAGCYGSSRVVLANDSGESVQLHVEVSDHSDEWNFTLPPRGAALLTVSPRFDSGLEVSAAVGARHVSSTAGYFERNSSEFECYRVDAELRLRSCQPRQRY